MGFENIHVVTAGILDSLIGVMDQTRWWLTPADSLLERRDGYSRRQRTIQRPADCLA
jgi:hypothetical protein